MVNKEENKNTGKIMNVDRDLQRRAKIQAAVAGMPLNAWVNQAMLEKLKREGD